MYINYVCRIADVRSILRHEKYMFLRRSFAHIGFMYVIFVGTFGALLGSPPPPPHTKSWLRYWSLLQSDAH